MTTTYDIARSIVYKVGGNPGNTAIVRAVAIWITFESGSRILGNNPLNMRPTSYPAGVQPCGVDNKNFIKFCSLDDATSTIAYQLNKKDWRGFDKIGAAIRAGSPLAFFSAVARSAWSSDNYGGGGKLINAFNSGANYNKTLTFGERGGGTSPGGGAISGSGSGSTSSGSGGFTLVGFTTPGTLQLDPEIAKLFQQVGLSTDPNHILNASDIHKLFQVYMIKYNLKGDPGGLEQSLMTQFLNHPLSDVIAQANTDAQDQGFLGIPGALKDLGNTLGDAFLTFVVILIGLAFIVGAFLLFRSNLNKEEAA